MWIGKRQKAAAGDVAASIKVWNGVILYHMHLEEKMNRKIWYYCVSDAMQMAIMLQIRK